MSIVLLPNDDDNDVNDDDDIRAWSRFMPRKETVNVPSTKEPWVNSTERDERGMRERGERG